MDARTGQTGPTDMSTEGVSREPGKPVLAPAQCAPPRGPHPSEMPCGQWVPGPDARERQGRGGGRELTEVVGRKGENLGERQGHGG